MRRPATLIPMPHLTVLTLYLFLTTLVFIDCIQIVITLILNFKHKLFGVLLKQQLSKYIFILIKITYDFDLTIFFNITMIPVVPRVPI